MLTGFQMHASISVQKVYGIIFIPVLAYNTMEV